MTASTTLSLKVPLSTAFPQARIYLLFFFILFFFFGFVRSASGQCPHSARVYANEQKFYGSGILGLLPGTIENAGLAVDGLVNTRSTLKVDLGLLNASHAIQYLKFPTAIAAGTPVTIKLTLPASAVGLIDNFIIQPFNNLHWNNALAIFGGQRWEATAAGSPYTGATLLNALSGKGDVEITITPTVGYEGVWIDVGSLVGVGVSMDVYHAYVMQSTTADIDCDERIDVLAGVRAGTVVGGVANATGGVSNPADPMGTLGTAKWAATDVDPAYATYAQLNTGVKVLSELYHTTIFSTPSFAGDSLKIVLQDPGALLLDLGLLNGVIIQPYLGTVPAGPELKNTSSLLKLNLLSSAGNLHVLTAAVASAFDRIEIKIGGVAGALQSIRIYDVTRKIPLPKLTANVNGSPLPDIICSNATAGITFTRDNTTCTKYTWHNGTTDAVITAGVSADGLSFTPAISAGGVYKYYVKAIREKCNISVVQPIVSATQVLTVLARPGSPYLTIQVN